MSKTTNKFSPGDDVPQSVGSTRHGVVSVVIRTTLQIFVDAVTVLYVKEIDGDGQAPMWRTAISD